MMLETLLKEIEMLRQQVSELKAENKRLSKQSTEQSGDELSVL